MACYASRGHHLLPQVLPSKQLRARTYRIERDHTVLLGAGLARLDIISAPGPTLYLTVFVSAHVNLHMGKTEGEITSFPHHSIHRPHVGKG